MTCDCACSSSPRRPRRGLTLVAISALLFVALGGTAFAAGSLARNSVGSVQIKKNAVTTSKLHSDAVTSGKIRNRSVTGSDIAPSSLTGTELADGSVTGADLADGSVTGADLADRSIGGQKIAGNSIGLQAIEESTQNFLTDVPTTQVMPTRSSDLDLTVNAQPVLSWIVAPGHEGLNLLQATVSVRTTKSVSVSCDLTIDGVAATRVRQTIARTDSKYDFASFPLMTTARVKAGSVVAARCDAGEVRVASAVLTDSEENRTSSSTTLIATRVAR